MDNFYAVSKRISHLYSLLQDDVSREIFFARLQFDICPSIGGWLHLANLSGKISPEAFSAQMGWERALKSLAEQKKS